MTECERTFSGTSGAFVNHSASAQDCITPLAYLLPAFAFSSTSLLKRVTQVRRTLSDGESGQRVNVDLQEIENKQRFRQCYLRSCSHRVVVGIQGIHKCLNIVPENRFLFSGSYKAIGNQFTYPPCIVPRISTARVLSIDGTDASPVVMAERNPALTYA